MNLLTIFTNVVITTISFNAKYSESRTEALTPHDTSILDKPERVPFVITYDPALRFISSIIRKHFHVLISSPRCYNVFKAAPIVAYRCSSNLTDFLVRAETSQSHNTTSPGAHTHAEKTVSPCNTYRRTNFRTHSTLQAKPGLSLITLTVTPRTSFT